MSVDCVVEREAVASQVASTLFRCASDEAPLYAIIPAARVLEIERPVDANAWTFRALPPPSETPTISGLPATAAPTAAGLWTQVPPAAVPLIRSQFVPLYT